MPKMNDDQKFVPLQLNKYKHDTFSMLPGNQAYRDSNKIYCSTERIRTMILRRIHFNSGLFITLIHSAFLISFHPLDLFDMLFVILTCLIVVFLSMYGGCQSRKSM